MKKLKNLIFSVFIVLPFVAFNFFDGQESKEQHGAKLYNQSDGIIAPPFYSENTKWVDSVFKTLSPDERIAQLFMVAAYSNKGAEHVAKVEKLIKDHNIGGLIFFQGGPERQVNLINQYQKIAKTPLLMSIDGEWGLAMRLDSTIKFPKQMTLGAIQNEELIYEMGVEIAKQCREVGLQVNFAPVADINNNAKNPVINYRSFGEERENVARKTYQYMKGMQDQRVLANAKHFPGHGDTDSDSHHTLPIIKHTRNRLDSLELYPFKYLFERGLGSIMVAHLHIPALDSTKNRATTLSPNVVNGLLKEEMGFKGLIFTDAMNMKGVSAHNEPGHADLLAIKAGNDILLFPADVPKGIKFIKEAIARGEISQKEIDDRCYKLLRVKYWTGLHKKQTLSTKALHKRLNNNEALAINNKLYAAALTVLKNEKNLIPFRNVDTVKLASVAINLEKSNTLDTYLSRYLPVKGFTIKAGESVTELNTKLKEFNHVVVTIHGMNQKTGSNFGINQAVKTLVSSLCENNNVILNISGNPYSLNNFSEVEKAKVIILSYEDEKAVSDVVSQMIVGAISAEGKLPISAGKYKVGHGISTTGDIRTGFVLPEQIGIKSSFLAKVDSIALNAIKEQVFPGCQIVAAKDGKIFYSKSFGHHTYDKTTEVKTTDLYDLASITKIAATTLSLMRLQGEGRYDVDKVLCDYLSYTDSSQYDSVNMKQMLAHQAGFEPWIPFFLKTIKEGKPSPLIYSKTPNDSMSLQVADNLFILNSYKDSIYNRILKTNLLKEKKYKYSDIGYYFLMDIIQRQTNMSLAEYVDKTFYSPIGLYKVTYNPLSKFSKEEIIPTENDKKFRGQLIHGYVHDQGAAMLGGVCGHAGLFSNAEQLTMLMQMIVNGGKYAGQEYLKKDMIKYYTKSHFLDNKNRRAIGFDKPVSEGGAGPTCSKCASNNSFGHTGFTGTITWADPDKGLVYVLLSNRVHPDAENNKITKMSIRTDIQKVFYDAINIPSPKAL
ncbi:MAG: glycoside hydrolase family 3 N-terminal domain-containing protein [Flavobacteriales bacterium]